MSYGRTRWSGGVGAIAAMGNTRTPEKTTRHHTKPKPKAPIVLKVPMRRAVIKGKVPLSWQHLTAASPVTSIYPAGTSSDTAVPPTAVSSQMPTAAIPPGAGSMALAPTSPDLGPLPGPDDVGPLPDDAASAAKPPMSTKAKVGIGLGIAGALAYLFMHHK